MLVSKDFMLQNGKVVDGVVDVQPVKVYSEKYIVDNILKYTQDALNKAFEDGYDPKFLSFNMNGYEALVLAMDSFPEFIMGKHVILVPLQSEIVKVVLRTHEQYLLERFD